MDRDEARSLLERLHAAQGAFYAGDDASPLRELLEHDVAWTIPGDNVIVGTYAGFEAVLAYFRAAGRCQTRRSGCTPMLGGVEHRWSTVGLYRIDAGTDRCVQAARP